MFSASSFHPSFVMRVDPAGSVERKEPLRTYTVRMKNTRNPASIPSRRYPDSQYPNTGGTTLICYNLAHKGMVEWLCAVASNVYHMSPLSCVLLLRFLKPPPRFSNTTSRSLPWPGGSPADKLHFRPVACPPADIIHLLAFGKTEEAANAAPAQSSTLGAESLVASQVSNQVTGRLQKASGSQISS
jgi:hypothetical protein